MSWNCVEPKGMLGLRPGLEQDKEIFIHWRGLRAADTTWESFGVMMRQFLKIHLDDKVKVWPAGVDKPPLRNTFFFWKAQYTILMQGEREMRPNDPWGVG